MGIAATATAATATVAATAATVSFPATATAVDNAVAFRCCWHVIYLSSVPEEDLAITRTVPEAVERS